MSWSAMVDIEVKEPQWVDGWILVDPGIARVGHIGVGVHYE